jgi:hypothetical protein
VSGGGPTAVTVAEETPVSLLVSWDSPNAHVLQYRVSYSALSATEPRDTTVSTAPTGDPPTGGSGGYGGLEI